MDLVRRHSHGRLEDNMKKKWLEVVAAYSMIYTAITLLNSALYLGSGVYEDPSGNWHELDQIGRAHV